MTPSLATSQKRADASLRMAAQLAEPALSFVEGLGQGLPIDESVRPRGQAAGVSEKEVEGRSYRDILPRHSPVEHSCCRH
ncbi:MAG: hypothetical protein WD425_12800 [Nitrospirales bacterium]